MTNKNIEKVKKEFEEKITLPTHKGGFWTSTLEDSDLDNEKLWDFIQQKLKEERKRVVEEIKIEIGQELAEFSKETTKDKIRTALFYYFRHKK